MRVLDNRKRLVIRKIARKHFKKHGFTKTSMQLIAHEARLAVGTLYLYYPTKAELLRETVQEYIDDHSKLTQLVVKSKKKISKRIELYLKERFEAVAEVRSHGSRSAELNLKIFELFPDRRRHESQMMFSTLYKLLEQSIKEGEFRRIKDIDYDLMVFMHSISWFFLHSNEFYDEPPKWDRLRQIINWFIEKWR